MFRFSESNWPLIVLKYLNQPTFVHHITRLLVLCLDGSPADRTPPSAVSGHCPSTRPSVDPSRSGAQAEGRGEAGHMRRGSAAH